MKKIVILLLALVLAVTGCKSGTVYTNGDADSGSIAESLPSQTNASAAKTMDGEIKFYPTYDSDYKTGYNEMFDFWFDIPVDWKAVDRSEDGSAYHILSDNKNVEIVIYGEFMDEPEDEFYSRLAGSGGMISEFTFRDGWIGKRIDASENEVYYVRVDGDSYLVFHLDAAKDAEWKKQNEDKINYMAMSIRTTRESYGKVMAGENDITLDDLMLGNLKPGMTYDELLEAMDQEPEHVEEKEYEGLLTKMLFFSDDTQVYVVNDVVYTINVTSPKYVTPRGLKTGDNEARIKELYGEPSSMSDGVWGYEYNGYELFTVVVTNGKVSQIQVDQVM